MLVHLRPRSYRVASDNREVNKNKISLPVKTLTGKGCNLPALKSINRFWCSFVSFLIFFRIDYGFFIYFARDRDSQSKVYAHTSDPSGLFFTSVRKHKYKQEIGKDR